MSWFYRRCNENAQTVLIFKKMGGENGFQNGFQKV